MCQCNVVSNQGPSEEFPSQGLLFTNMVGNKVNHGDEVGWAGLKVVNMVGGAKWIYPIMDELLE